MRAFFFFYSFFYQHPPNVIKLDYLLILFPAQSLFLCMYHHCLLYVFCTKQTIKYISFKAPDVQCAAVIFKINCSTDGTWSKRNKEKFNSQIPETDGFLRALLEQRCSFILYILHSFIIICLSDNTWHILLSILCRWKVKWCIKFPLYGKCGQNPKQKAWLDKES